THMLCWSWAIYFWAAASSENDQGSMNLDSKTAPVPSTRPSRVAARNRMAGCSTRRWTAVTTWPVLRSYQSRFRPLSHDAKLHNQIAREVLRLGLASLLLPQAQEGGFVSAHDDAGV